MLIIADSGSTKTSWSIIDGQRIVHKETIGLNPLLTEESVIRQSFIDVIKEAGNNRVKSVYFYGAGCVSEILCNKVKKAISSVAKNDAIFVQSDIYAAARGLLNNQAGWIAILGTGANLAHYDGYELKKHNPSLGYIVGDEGSGAYLGKELLKMIYYKQCSDELIRAFEEYTNATLSDILENIYQKPFANRYLASFTYFIKQNETNESIKILLLDTFKNFIKLHILPYINLYNPTIAFTGSVAYIFQDQLKEACNHYGLEILAIEKSPMQGLINYHIKLMNKPE
ncbi:MAG: ATPase [Bacteroidales bacterium]